MSTATKWFHAGPRTGWRKADNMKKRRAAVLRSRHGDYLKAGRALLALANVTRDKETKRKARKDAEYFFRQHRKKS